jgi:hypothetical protein
MASPGRKSLWVKETPGGGTEFRKGTKFLLAMVPVAIAALFYRLLLAIEALSNGREVLVVLAYALIVLVAVLVLLVLMVALIEYLRRFE